MKRILVVLAAILAVAIAALGYSFAPARLPAGDAPDIVVPDARPPAGMRIAVLHTGKMFSQAGFAYRGGNLAEQREFGMAGILVEHPRGKLLFDTGFGSQVDAHVKTIQLLMRLTSKYQKETPVAEQLAQAGIAPSSLLGVVLTHAHWDHVSGLQDLPDVPVWVNAAEREFIESDEEATALARAVGPLNFKNYEFSDGPYLGFEKSLDVFGDGSVVLVPAPGHTPGSVIAFVTLPEGQRYALVGDLVWQREGIEIPAEKPWVSSRMVDDDRAQMRRWIVHMHHLSKLLPDMVIVPAHDRRVHEALPPLEGAG